MHKLNVMMKWQFLQ